MIETKVKLIRNNIGLVPKKMTDGAAGYDCHSTVAVKISAGTVAKIPLGFALQMEPGIHAEICSRSGLMSKGIFAISGIIDSDYRGEVNAVLYNSTGKEYTVLPGDRVCQLVIRNNILHSFKLVEELDGSARGEGGFGSTGK